jgi:hypothetical protein
MPGGGEGRRTSRKVSGVRCDLGAIYLRPCMAYREESRRAWRLWGTEQPYRLQIERYTKGLLLEYL